MPRRPLRSGHLEAVADVDLGPELGERMDVRVEAATSDHVTARRRHADAADTREQWAGEQERRAHPAAQLLVEVPLANLRRADAHLVRPGPFHLGADVGEQRDHRVDVADARHVRQRHGPFGEQARREDRQRAVLVSRGPDGA